FADMPDVSSAEYHTSWARFQAANAKKDATWAKEYEKAESIVKAYENVKFDSTKSDEQVKAAHDKAAEQLKELFKSDYLIDPDIYNSYFFSDLKTTAKANQAARELYAARHDVWTNYWLSSGTTMDVNERVIQIAKLNAAYDLAIAQEAAANAKAAALQAQATAIALVKDAIKAAQDAAATAVANAQAEAYNALTSAYADAVESFWGEVELYMLGLG
nr:hypothetical protein [Clostridia bacterium]